MKIIYANESLDLLFGKTIFLVGPTPRSSSVPSWRPDALELFQNKGFNGNIIVPEVKSGERYPDYLDQVEFEYKGLNKADVILAWVPRNMVNMPALTTNVEFGFWMSRDPGKVIYGRPENAENTRYLDWLYCKATDRTPCKTLEELVVSCIGVV